MAVSTEQHQAVLAHGVLPVEGVRLAAAASGARYKGRDDVALIALDPGCVVHCLFTRNRFCAAPVTIAREHQAAGTPRYLVINAGNANAGTGPAGEKAAREVCAAVAAQADCAAQAVLPFSTGVIGQQLDASKIGACVPRLFDTLGADAWPRAAAAIMTTDTRAKVRSASVSCNGRQVSVTGMAKGSGMIRPDMATMLAYVATDAAIAPDALAKMAREAADASFNRITVDGDTSTNDAFALIATGRAGNPALSGPQDPDWAAVREAITLVCGELARDIVRDGEGATKFVTVRVHGGREESDCLRVAYVVAESPLVKTALFASDPNWGRILAAVGRAGLSSLDLGEVDIDIGPCPIVRAGGPVADYDESATAAVMRESDIEITIRIGQGDQSATVWTCDLSYDYVRINAEYRS